jgi:hypothetical protein
MSDDVPRDGMESLVREIRTCIEAIENDKLLYEECNFSDRVDALDSLEFDVIERIESLLLTNGRHEDRCWEDSGTSQE